MLMDKFDEQWKHISEYCSGCDEVVEVYQVNSIGHVGWHCVKCRKLIDELYHDGPYQEDY
jgi:hypothetical protein